MAQVLGSELQVGQDFTTVDGLRGVVSEIVPHRKGWREVFTGTPKPFYIFDNEYLDVQDE